MNHIHKLFGRISSYPIFDFQCILFFRVLEVGSNSLPNLLFLMLLDISTQGVETVCSLSAYFTTKIQC